MDCDCGLTVGCEKCRPNNHGWKPYIPPGYYYIEGHYAPIQREEDVSDEFSFDEIVVNLRRGDVVRWLAQLDAIKAALQDFDHFNLFLQLSNLTIELSAILDPEGADE